MSPHEFRLGPLRCSTHTVFQLLEEVRALLADKTLQPRTILCVNAHIYNLAWSDAELRQVLNEARIVAADGMGIVAAAFASRDMREWGLPRTTLACIARLCQALLIHAPLLAWAKMTGDKACSLTRACLFLRAVSYARRTLYIISPALFPQDNLGKRTDLRSEPKHAGQSSERVNGAS